MVFSCNITEEQLKSMKNINKILIFCGGKWQSVMNIILFKNQLMDLNSRDIKCDQF